MVVGITLAVGAVVLVFTLHQSLRNGVVSNATSEATDVGQIVSTGSIPAALPVRSGLATEVVTADGRVLTSTPDLAGRPALSSLHPPVGQQRVLALPGVLARDDDADAGVALTVQSPRGPLTVYSLASVEQIEASTHSLALALAVALPILLLLVGILSWRLASRALRPVEEIRQEVTNISAHELGRRVPEPPNDDEVARLARTMNAMLGRLEESTERQSRFVSDASHELRSPLGGLLAQIEVAKAHPERADWPSVADAVADEGSRIANIVNDLLLLARADEGYLQPRRDLVDLDELVFDEVARLRSRGRVQVDARAVGAGRVLGDRPALQRVLRNLVDNAERHAASTVTFSLEQRDESVELVVADDGPGIPVDQRTRIFDRFTRLDESRRRDEGGTGLGLAIVGEVVAAHGGVVEVADAPAGARMVVTLPAVDE